MSAAPAAPTPPTVEELSALIVALQAQVNALRAAPTAVVFAETPQTIEVNNLINYSTKRGAEIYKQGCAPLDNKSLTEGFNMTPDQTVTFVEAFQRCFTKMGWIAGTKGITSFVNRDGNTINIIKRYGQIDEVTLRTACDRFCKASEADAKSQARQNNTMMGICLLKLLTAEAQARLLTYCKDYLINEVECALLLYKVIMRLAMIDSIATTQALRDNLHALGTFASTVSGSIDKINCEFDKNYSQIIACGATVNNPIGILFSAYQVVPCYHFKSYINRMHKDYLNGKLATLTHESLVGMAKSKFNYLCTKGIWGAKSPNDDKIIAMTAAFNTLKGQLKLSPQLAAAGGKDDGKPKKGQKTRNKKNTSDRVKQKKDDAWKKVPPKEGEKKEKVHNKCMYHLCVHHMAWTMHSPSECHLGTEQKMENKNKSYSAALAAAATINPQYAALLVTLASIANKE
jgi:hypothetical protein